MATIVLVPGGYHGGWWFQPIVRRLQARGHVVYAVTLTGVGERSHLATAATNVDTHVQDLINVLEYEDLTDVVLCGHSYAGMVIATMVDRLPERVAAVVLLDAQVPRDGESLFSLTTDAERVRMLDSTDDGVLTAPPPGLDPRTTAHPLASFLQPVRLEVGLDRIEDKVYVYMAGWPDSPLAAMYERVKDRPGWRTEEWPTGHDIVGQALEETVNLLVRVAARHDGGQ